MHLDQKECEHYYCNQIGSGQYFTGINHQRGYGLFSQIFRQIRPLALKTAKYLGRKMLKSGTDIVSDLEHGTSLRNSVRNRFKEATSQIKDDLFRKLEQEGKGYKRRRPPKKKHLINKKLKRKDIFS